jgi:hypothetical protein
MEKLIEKMEINSQSCIDYFREKYPAQPPRLRAIKNNDELRKLNLEEGVEEFDICLGAKAKKGDLPVSHPTNNPYLWVIGKGNIPAILEASEIGKILESKVVKHTNLTGGKDAHCGGEVWFLEDDKIIISGSSGRYGPDNGEKLVDAARVFKEQGYQVAHLGMDESGFPSVLLVGDPEWI